LGNSDRAVGAAGRPGGGRRLRPRLVRQDRVDRQAATRLGRPGRGQVPRLDGPVRQTGACPL
jgi:hypothetical protein